MRLFLTLIITICWLSSLAQELDNPSFEGKNGAATTPFGWETYGEASSPDIQPGAWNVKKEANHGNTYLSMVCRGLCNINSYKHEGVKQVLKNPLISNNFYAYSIDLAFSETFVADTFKFKRFAKLRISGINDWNEIEILWESDEIQNTEWKTFKFEIHPKHRINSLIIEVIYANQQMYNGHILLDNLRYYPYGFPSKKGPIEQLDSSITPLCNVSFTDGIPTKINEREVFQEKELFFNGNKLMLTIWDHRTLDGDIISLFLNGKTLLSKLKLSKNRLTIPIELPAGEEYYLTLYAHNLGGIPPNTAALYISDGKKKKFITLSSNLEKCESVKINIIKEVMN